MARRRSGRTSLKTVVDASVALAVLLPDEDSPELGNLFAANEPDRLIAPALIDLEITNSLLSNARRGRLTEDAARRLLTAMSLLPVARRSESALSAIFELGRQHGLSAYDATYLHLAVENSALLATFDVRLRTAAASIGIGVVPASLEA